MNTSAALSLDPQEDEFLTISQLAQRYPAFTEGSIRWMRFNNTNGFNKCVRKIGKKCVVSLHGFHQWIESGANSTHDNK